MTHDTEEPSAASAGYAGFRKEERISFSDKKHDKPQPTHPDVAPYGIQRWLWMGRPQA